MQKKTACFLLALLCAAAPPRGDLLSLSAAPQPSPGFKNLPYANPAAPHGGAFTIATIGDFDQLNPFILRGTAPASIFRIWQPLFKPSDADSVTAYADLAQSADISPDGLTVTFHLNPAARFSDGTPVTAADVVWTYNTLVTQGAPIYADLYGVVATAAAPTPLTAVFTFHQGASRAAILNLAEMYILPAHFWSHRDFATPLTDPPIGSGPYQIAAVSYGDQITYRHVLNWWAQSNPADVGFYNFATFTEQFYHSDAVALQAFLARQLDARIEPSEPVWLAGYHTTEADKNNLARAQAPLGLPAGVHGFVMNTRRPIFADPRTRQALTLAFDFQWIDRVFDHNTQTRETSFFTNSPMASSGLASPAELNLLQPFAGQIPRAVFQTPYTLPITDGSGDNLPELRQAYALLLAAGWRLQNWRLVNAQGQPFAFDILLADPHDEALAFPYIADLKDLGIDAHIRTLDPATYQRHLENDDFDMTVESIPATGYPDTEQADYWGCAAAQKPGGYNLAGICAPAIDAMIAAEITAKTPPQKTTAIHALDRLLLNSWIIIPWGAAKSENLAYWRDEVSPQAAPLQIGVDYDLWWATK